MVLLIVRGLRLRGVYSFGHCSDERTSTPIREMKSHTRGFPKDTLGPLLRNFTLIPTTPTGRLPCIEFYLENSLQWGFLSLSKKTRTAPPRVWKVT